MKNRKNLATFDARAEPVGGEGSRVIRFVGSTPDVARDGGILEADGWETEAYLRNPVFLYAHDHSGLPVGRTVTLKGEKTGLEFDVEFAPRDVHPFADTVFRLYQTGFLRGVSVGFRTLETRVPSSDEKARGAEWVSTRHELLELSAVPVGADSNALAVAARALSPDDVPALRRMGLEPFERLAKEIETMKTKKRATISETGDGALVAVLRPAEDFDEGTDFSEYPFEGESPSPVTILAGMLGGEIAAQGLVFGEGWDLETAQAWADENEETLLAWRAPEEETPEEEVDPDEETPEEGENSNDDDGEGQTGLARLVTFLRDVARRLDAEASTLERALEGEEGDPDQPAADDSEGSPRSKTSAETRDSDSDDQDPYGILEKARAFAGA